MKSNQTGNYVIVDGGINHLVYYGSTLAMKVPPFEVLGNNKKEKDTYNIYGSLCTTNDVLIKNIELNKLSLGDTFVFKMTGAYSSTEGISLFLSRDLPKIILNKGNDFICVRDIIRTSDINYPNYEKEN
jgi:diaminopimelate decarboxylase